MTTNAANKFAGDGPSTAQLWQPAFQASADLSHWTRLDAAEIDYRLCRWSKGSHRESLLQALWQKAASPFVAHAKIACRLTDHWPPIWAQSSRRVHQRRTEDIRRAQRQPWYNGRTSEESYYGHFHRQSIRNIKSGKLAGFTATESNQELTKDVATCRRCRSDYFEHFWQQRKEGFISCRSRHLYRQRFHFEKGDLVGMETIDFDKAIGNHWIMPIGTRIRSSS